MRPSAVHRQEYRADRRPCHQCGGDGLLCRDRPDPARPRTRRRGGGGGLNMARARMLLVEDDAALAELLIWPFQREDFEVVHTVDGEEALLLAQENAHDTGMLIRKRVV